MYDGWLVDCFFVEKPELSSFLRGNLRWYGEKVGQYFDCCFSDENRM